MKNKEIYKHKIKAGAKLKMCGLLKYAENGSAIIDSSLCIITAVIPLSKNIFHNLENYTNVYQIKILNSDSSHEALILPDLLDEMPYEEWIIKSKDEV